MSRRYEPLNYREGHEVSERRHDERTNKLHKRGSTQVAAARFVFREVCSRLNAPAASASKQRSVDTELPGASPEKMAWMKRESRAEDLRVLFTAKEQRLTVLASLVAGACMVTGGIMRPPLWWAFWPAVAVLVQVRTWRWYLWSGRSPDAEALDHRIHDVVKSNPVFCILIVQAIAFGTTGIIAIGAGDDDWKWAMVTGWSVAAIAAGLLFLRTHKPDTEGNGV